MTSTAHSLQYKGVYMFNNESLFVYDSNHKDNHQR